MGQTILKASECLGINLKALREASGLSLIELARLTGMSKQSIWNYENNVRFPTAEALASIAKYFKVEETDLFNPKLASLITKLK